MSHPLLGRHASVAPEIDFRIRDGSSCVSGVLYARPGESLYWRAGRRELKCPAARRTARMRPRLSAIKPLLVAAGLLLTSACGTELFLRIHEAEVGGNNSRACANGLVEPSPIVYERLRPLSALVSRDPDTEAPVE